MTPASKNPYAYLILETIGIPATELPKFEEVRLDMKSIVLCLKSEHYDMVPELNWLPLFQRMDGAIMHFHVPHENAQVFSEIMPKQPSPKARGATC